MADGDAGRCEPYRVEWRSSLVTRWTLLGKRGTLSEAEALVDVYRTGPDEGQARVLEQRVVLVRGLGQDEGIPRDLSEDGEAPDRRSVVSDPDDRRDVEAAADAGQPLGVSPLAGLDAVLRIQDEAQREPVTDMAGCAHRMSSGAVSLTACGECGAQPGDDCMAWRVLDATAAKIGGTSPLEAMMLYTAAELEALLADHGEPPGTDPWWRRLLARIHSG